MWSGAARDYSEGARELRSNLARIEPARKGWKKDPVS